MPYVNNLFYRKESGEGRPLLFVHGWLGSNESWSLVEKNLDLENPMIFYDQRCHGNSKCKEFEVEDLAKDLKSLIDELDLEKPVLIGHSMGGMTSLTYAALYNNLEYLILLGTCISTPKPKIGSPKYFLNELDTMNREEWAEKIAENYVGEVKDKKLKEMSKKELMEANDKPIRYGLRAMDNYNLKDKVDNITSQSTVIAGSKDSAITLEMSKNLADLLDSNLIKIECGHLMLQEEPEKVAEIIAEIIQTEVK